MKTTGMRLMVALVAYVALVMIGCSHPTDTNNNNNNPNGNTTNGYFTITKPAHGDSVLLNSTTIPVVWTWTTAMTDSFVSIKLYKGGNFIRTLVPSIRDTLGTTTLSILSTFAGSGTDYQLRLSSVSDPNQYDMGCYFTIYSTYSGTYTVTSPTADSSWSTGLTHYIQWTTTGTLGPATTINLYYDTSLISTLTAAATTGTGSYAWTITNTTANYENSNRYSIRVSNTADMGFYAYSQHFAIYGGVDPDSYEPDGSMALAKSITTNGVAQNRTLTFHDTDWVSFSAVSGTTYTIQTFGALDTYMYLDSTDGTTEITHNDDAVGLNSRIIWPCTVSGTYYFKVRGYANRWMGAYTVSVQ